ncbi:MAG TPA: AmmeMemoRadiSam system protein A [Polyangiaceae bacterium]
MSGDTALLDPIGAELARIARRALRAHLGTPPRSWRDEVRERLDLPKYPVFVTLRSPDGALRGCIGSLKPQEPNVALETARIAVLSATEDPRFDPLPFAEIDELGIEVSVLLPEEPFDDPRELDDGQHGVVVRDGVGRQGVLLPGVPGVKNGDEQIALARRKAGIEASARVTMGRFSVRKFD